jgi:hypothetical protein
MPTRCWQRTVAGGAAPVNPQVSGASLRRLCFTDGHRHDARAPIVASRDSRHLVSVPEMRMRNRRATPAVPRPISPYTFPSLAGPVTLLPNGPGQTRNWRVFGSVLI